MMPTGSGFTTQNIIPKNVVYEIYGVKIPMVWQEEPADSWEETLEVKDSWEMEEETAKVKKSIKPRISGSIVDPH
jgi:hypothetical protein